MPAEYEGTDIISCLRSKYIIRHSRISYRASDISLKNVTFYDKIPMKIGVFMSENKLLDLSFDFAVDIVNLCRTIKETKKETVLPTNLYSVIALFKAENVSGEFFVNDDESSKLSYFGLDELPTLESRAERIIEWLRVNYNVQMK